jgi:hypothetical protein
MEPRSGPSFQDQIAAKDEEIQQLRLILDIIDSVPDRELTQAERQVLDDA